MLTDALTSATQLRWTPAGAGGTNVIGAGGLLEANWCPKIPTFDVEQIGLGISLVTAAASTFCMRLRGSHDGSTWYTITVRTLGAVVAGAQRYSIAAYELGPQVGAAAGTVLVDESRPWNWHFLSIGFYNPAGAPAVGDQVDVVIERQRGAQIQGWV